MESNDSGGNINCKNTNLEESKNSSCCDKNGSKPELERLMMQESKEDSAVSVIDEKNEDIKLKSSETSISDEIKGLAAEESNDNNSENIVTPVLENNFEQELIQYKDICEDFKNKFEQMKIELDQKNNLIKLFEREKSILEKEKCALKHHTDVAIKEKESIVIRYATKEKVLLDLKKEKEQAEKQLQDSKKEIKNITIKFQSLNEEKSRITNMLDEKCAENRKQKQENEKFKQDINNLETKLKWNTIKLNQEVENKVALEKKLEEEINSSNKIDEKETEKKRVENEASLILLKHEAGDKERKLESLKKEYKMMSEKASNLQDSLSKEKENKSIITFELDRLKQEHNSVQNSLSQELLNSAKLRGQLEELNILKTQNTINEDKIKSLNEVNKQLEENSAILNEDLKQLRIKENELMSVNKEISEITVDLQNRILLQTSKAKGIEAELEIYKKEKLEYDTKYNDLDSRLQTELKQRNDERLLLTKQLAEKTKLSEITKEKLDNALGDLEATKKKHSQVFKELNREIQKYKKVYNEHNPLKIGFESKISSSRESQSSHEDLFQQQARSSSSQQASDNELENNSTLNQQNLQEPSTQHLVNRILRLQKSAARQTEKIDFLENHTMSLVAELQKKSKLIQYYMIRDQSGALTSTKMDQNKSELQKYGGVMSAIYSGLKGANSSPSSMTLELSLEINKKMQCLLEDTLLKNITLKENLNVMGLEIDKLTRQVAELQQTTS